jgi:hypothetical protein
MRVWIAVERPSWIAALLVWLHPVLERYASYLSPYLGE